MYKYKIRLTNGHIHFYEEGDEVIYFQAIDDYDAHDKAQSILTKYREYNQGILTTYLTGRMSMKWKPGFCDYLILSKTNDHITFSNLKKRMPHILQHSF